MVNSKQAKSKTEEKSQGNCFNCCDSNFEEMFNNMQEFCGSKEKSFDCCAMMQQMFDKNAEEPSPFESTAPNGSLVPGDFPLEGRKIFIQGSYNFI